MFEQLKGEVKKHFDHMSAMPQLFYVSINRDRIWEEYLKGFSEETRQSHNCNCCKSFLRQYAGIVSITENPYSVTSIWDGLTVPEEYKQSIENIRNYIHSLPITDIFLNEFQKCGTDQNYDIHADVIWKHFYITLDKKFVVKKYDLDSMRSTYRENKQLLQRAVEELTLDSLNTVLELIAQDSLYRAKEQKELIKAFRDIKTAYDMTDRKELFLWKVSTQVGRAVSAIRNTSIGTLLVNLSEGMELDAAVSKYEAMVAPANYKRPTALVTPRMVEDAKNKLAEMGLIGSLERRHANVSDLSVENLLFTDKSSELFDVFDDMSKETLVNPKSFSKTEQISINDFLENVLPTVKSVEVLLENRHLPNLVSILTAQDREAKSLFKWDNPFSWSYVGGVADSIKERVKAAGGNVDGVLRFSIQWNEDGKSIVDLDAHAWEPGTNGKHIFYSGGFRKDYGNAFTPMSGQLDVDMINPGKIGIENIYWKDLSKMKEGNYTFKVNNYNSGRNDGFRAQIEFNGETYEFSHNKNFTGTMNVATVTYSKKTGFLIKGDLEMNSTVISKTQWNVNTNQFVKVKQIMLSPNMWEKQTGNKHFIFTLENCINDEQPRPFYNEFLKDEFQTNRKVFEVLGSKLKIPESQAQLSGIGFSDTQRNSVLVRVQGQFKRNLIINF